MLGPLLGQLRLQSPTPVLFQLIRPEHPRPHQFLVPARSLNFLLLWLRLIQELRYERTTFVHLSSPIAVPV